MSGSLAASFVAGLPPLLLVVAVSIAAAVYMLLVFHYFSDPKKIRRAKDQVQAQLLAVRLFQDQLSAVVFAYGRLLRAAAKYMRTMKKPALAVVVVLAPLIAWLDPYFGWEPLRPEQTFLMKVRTAEPESLNGLSLQLPAGIKSSAPPVHIPSEDEVVWRLVPFKDGTHQVSVHIDNAVFSVPVVVSRGVARTSPSTRRETPWKQLLEPGASSLPAHAPIRSVEISYQPREINLWVVQANWILVFFVTAIGAALLLRKAFRVEL